MYALKVAEEQRNELNSFYSIPTCSKRTGK